MAESPIIVVLAGPNGAGKTTISRDVLSQTLGISEFINADTIAQGLSGFDPERVAFQAGRLMISRLRELAKQRATFAFESTLASRTFAPWLRELASEGYAMHMFYVWLRSASLAVQRVRARARQGGHAIPDHVVRRRYLRSIRNFLTIYRPLGTTWRIYDNSERGELHLVASYDPLSGLTVADTSVLERIEAMARHDPSSHEDQDDR